MQGDAYIRSLFHIDPDTLQPSRWADLYAQALYIEGERMNHLAETLTQIAVAMFGKK